MADKETPAYIDYSGEGDEEWTGKELIKCFQSSFVKHHKRSVIVDSVKERSLAKRMVREYERDFLEKMVERWVTYDGRPNFTIFYMNRDEIAKQVIPKDYGWDD